MPALDEPGVPDLPCLGPVSPCPEPPIFVESEDVASSGDKPLYRRYRGLEDGRALANTAGVSVRIATTASAIRRECIAVELAPGYPFDSIS